VNQTVSIELRRHATFDDAPWEVRELLAGVALNLGVSMPKVYVGNSRTHSYYKRVEKIIVLQRGTGADKPEHIYSILHEFAHHVCHVVFNDLTIKREPHGHEFCTSLKSVIRTYGKPLGLINREYLIVKARVAVDVKDFVQYADVLISPEDDMDTLRTMVYAESNRKLTVNLGRR
jgi:hypothetical protein